MSSVELRSTGINWAKIPLEGSLSMGNQPQIAANCRRGSIQGANLSSISGQEDLLWGGTQPEG